MSEVITVVAAHAREGRLRLSWFDTSLMLGPLRPENIGRNAAPIESTRGAHQSNVIRQPTVSRRPTRRTVDWYNQGVPRSVVVLAALAIATVACGQAPQASEIRTGAQLQGAFAAPAELQGVTLVAESMRYLVWLPDGYGEDRDRQWPLIVFLHGSGDTDYNAPWVQSFGLPAVLHAGAQPDNFDFVVLSPQAAGGSAWWTGNTVDVLDALVDEITRTYLIDENRVYLTGLSMGGYGSWFLGMAHHDRFAAMASLSGSGWRQPVLPPGDVCAMAGLPIRAIHGARDLISDPPPNQAIVALYESVCETDVFFEIYPDAGHFETYEQAYRDPELYEWLLDHELSNRAR